MPPDFTSEQIGPDARTVFVVHGRDLGARDELFTFLRALGLKPLEWSSAVHSTGEASPFVATVLDAAFGKAQAVIVLLTPDELVRLDSRLVQRGAEDAMEVSEWAQARPNVLFEAGLALGRLPKRTIIVEWGVLRPFSDLAGRHVIRIADSPERRNELAQRLATAGCDVDTSGVDWLQAGNLSAGALATSGPQPTRVAAAGRALKSKTTKDASRAADQWCKLHLHLVGSHQVELEITNTATSALERIEIAVDGLIPLEKTIIPQLSPGSSTRVGYVWDGSISPVNVKLGCAIDRKKRRISRKMIPS